MDTTPRTVDAKVVTARDRQDWPHEPDATVVEVYVDGHLVGEVIVTEGPDHSNRDEETRPYLAMRGVAEQEAGLIGERDVFPCTVSHQGARHVSVSDA